MKTIKAAMIQSIATMFGLFFTTCSGDPDDPKIYRLEKQITSGGLVRTYVVNLPNTYYDKDSFAFPVVLALHGTGGSAEQMERMYGLNDKANSAGFIVVYPQGVRSNGPRGIRTWNAGRCCDYAMENDVDDVEFISEVIDALLIEFRINEKKIYLTGMSNGGMMAYRLACELSHKLAAIAPISSTMMAKQPCNPARTIPVLHIHSLLDTKVPYRGGVGLAGYNFSPVDSVLQLWSQMNGCASPTSTDNSRFIHTVWRECEDAAIESYLTYDGGHSWPGGQRAGSWADNPSSFINANDLMWDFFQRFELP
jgi:polyhydroxybutyrate depolymerase